MRLENFTLPNTSHHSSHESSQKRAALAETSCACVISYSVVEDFGRVPIFHLVAEPSVTDCGMRRERGPVGAMARKMQQEEMLQPVVDERIHKSHPSSRAE